MIKIITLIAAILLSIPSQASILMPNGTIYAAQIMNFGYDRTQSPPVLNGTVTGTIYAFTNTANMQSNTFASTLSYTCTSFAGFTLKDVETWLVANDPRFAGGVIQ